MNREERQSMSIRRVLKNNMYVLRILFGATPIYGISVIVEAVRHNLINFLEQTICVYIILDAIEHGRSYKIVLYTVLLFLAVDIIAAGISNLYEHFIKLKFLPVAQKKMKMLLYDKARRVDIACYDDTEYYNDFVMAVSQADRAIERAEQLIRMVFGCITVLACYGAFFITQDITSVIFVALSFALRTIFSNLLNKWQYKIKLKEIPLERKRDCVKRVFYLKKYAKELRLNKEISAELHRGFKEANDELYQINKRMGKKRFVLDFVAKYLVSDFALDIVYVLYLIIRSVLYGAISFSGIVVLYNSAANLRRGLSTIIDLGPYAMETSLYVEKIRTFLALETKIENRKTCEIPKGSGTLECRNVSFGYNEDSLILKNINMTIQARDKVALVGYNGAGKTTLIKLLLRLYDPTGGEILLNGINIKEFDINEYRKYIGIVFQDFQMFAGKVSENVVMDLVKEQDEPGILQAFEKSGFMSRYQTLPNGMDTQLTQEFDDSGVDLSGGEEQKLAVARAFYKNAGLVFLDEPSSALDPIAEYKLNMAMNEVANEKTVLFISHRLSTTRNANTIYVMKEGRIVEQGTHKELLGKSGIYAEMWNVQAGRYQ
ncbi:MAG: ABC transporter ATP-binding protein [Lachnospiraceae bacterium]|nr:ABC transporter ATP-binding protein [Lachnospiraceae bacterium]